MKESSLAPMGGVGWSRLARQTRWRAVAGLLLLVSLGLSGRAFAISAADEYTQRAQAAGMVNALGNELFGDQTDYYSGATSFAVTDVSLPGNSSLPVSVGRTHRVGANGPTAPGLFGEWDIDVPYLYGVFSATHGWTPGNRCSTNSAKPLPVKATSWNGPSYEEPTFDGSEYWDGNRLHIPGMGDQTLFLASTPLSQRPQGSAAYRWTTTNGWYFSCAGTDPGEYFVAVAPDGTRYTFNHGASRGFSVLSKPARFGPEIYTAHLYRRLVFLYATRVEDRFGNWVKYNWSGNELHSIEANDGRKISLTYQWVGTEGSVNTGYKISSISDGSQTWNYEYTSSFLTKVTLPDGTWWDLQLPPAFTVYAGFTQVGGDGCTRLATWYDSSHLYRMKHPSGATGEFTFKTKPHARDRVYPKCDWDYDKVDDKNKSPGRRFRTVALVSKKLSGPGLTDRNWGVSYPWLEGSWSNCSNCPTSKTVTVTDSSGTTEEYEYSTVYGVSEGKLLHKRVRDSSTQTLVSTLSYTYDDAWASPNPVYARSVGTVEYRGASPQDAMQIPARSRSIVQDGVFFTSSVDTCNGVACFDVFARPQRQVKANSLGHSRTETIAYHDNLTKWVIGQLESVTTAGTPSVIAGRTEYDANAMPWKLYGPGTASTPGKLQQTRTYNTTATVETGQLGTLVTSADGRGHVTTFSDWKRGIPRKVRFPATSESPTGALLELEVNDQGTIAWIEDEADNRTCYGYDAMRRLARITYPSEVARVCDESVWAPTTQTFGPVNVVELGAPAGHWKQTISTGNARKITYFDAMWRPMLEQSFDALDIDNTRSIAIKRYDAAGNLSFQSYPRRILDYTDPALTGTWMSYDRLGRLVRSDQDSELDAPLNKLSTVTEYLPGFKIRVTNPRGKQTTTSYLTYDEPTTDWPLVIEHPEGAFTDIGRDVFGKPTYVKRHNAGSVASTRWLVYDSHQQLCKRTDPEAAATVMAYDDAGNPAWTASGQMLGSITDCQREGVTAGEKVVRSYDARNRLQTLTFPDGNGNQTWSYRANGLVKDVTTWNEAGAVSVVNAYTYNRRGLLTGEAMSQPGFTWSLGYGYNQQGHQAVSLTQPGGEVLNFAPNALGQATQVASGYGNYATGVKYFPNGAIERFTYGNGIVHAMVQNARGLPERSQDAFGGIAVLDDSYDYDANGNVAAISDGLAGGRGNRTMAYDGLDRLTKVVSPMYATAVDSEARYGYDALDNLVTLHVKDRHQFYCYDGNGRLEVIKTSYCATGSAVVGLGYDVRGNVNNKNGQEFLFDFGNRLREAVGKETYRYDAHGRRVLGRSALGAGDIRSMYGLDGVLRYQQDDRRNKVFNYIYLAGSLIATRETPYNSSTNTIKYQHTDALGSPVAVTSASQTVLERNEYEPYGKVIAPASPQDGPGYTGHVFDSVTGLNYMQQRYYDPGIGRFLSVDPVTANGSTGANFNRYWYGNNNPYKFTDPDGRQVAPVGLPPVRQEQRVPIPVAQKMQAAQNAAVPKTVYVTGSAAGARGGSPAISGSVEVGKFTVSAGKGGLDADASVGSARIDTVAGSADLTSNQPTSGMAAGAGVSGPGGSIGITNAESAKGIADIPMTKVVTPLISFGWGSDNKGKWAVEVGGGAKGQLGIEKPKSDE